MLRGFGNHPDLVGIKSKNLMVNTIFLERRFPQVLRWNPERFMISNNFKENKFIKPLI